MSSAIFDAWAFKSDSPITVRIQEQTAAYGKATNEKGASTRRQLKQNVVKKFTDYDNYDCEQKSDLVLFYKVDSMYEAEKEMLTLAVREPQFRVYLPKALQTTPAKRKYGRAPATHLEREPQEWVGQLLM
ncbi:unnamed protein product [Prorocentrum cordatum]|uniref:Uncharacterized protein n=1 Tax=Prorocentrum cordatum TaxID=2364126 RepID=A0ABN9R971_9DINO|nr:unnamed protein product [Polarella glacialis]